MTAPRIRHDKEAYWGLRQEVEYLEELGTGKWSRNCQMERVDLLRSYIATVGQRSEPWVSKARKEAERLLQEELL